MFSTKSFFVAFVAFVGAQVVSAAALAPATITACSGAGNPPQGCVTIPVVSDDCTDLTGGLSFLNKEITVVTVPDGFVCSFYSEFGCLGSQNAHNVVVLTGGTWDMSSVPGIASTQDFNDMTSSFTCSPV
ncbi:hypothetical protein DFJ43DRAFT_1158717 [Lentinula guzmanii]|uniref:Uncharacterized protein n=3 Tax=Lentinula TaxID=5352 RepID=A0AA38J5U0_9AGAR|nr:hypothetical protein DFJ43DRAFT_1158717 [Lentinula guzmanii]KAJ3786850.1 hypothetical protein GGU10DRAFT_433512 [Lentinula aff. detonsa]KAJ3989345.1 hypothetical protein F5890DRAFT_1549785 [Lentinula detonsa]